MDGYNNNNRPSGAPQTSRPVAPRPASSEATNSVSHKRGRSSKKLLFWIGGIVIVVALLVTAYLLFFNPDKVNGSRYQAVFLSNGQVYFGKLHGYYGSHPYLTDVYYIQAQNGTTDSKTTATANNSQLIKLGEEVHKPENLMILNKESILFVENLQTDSQVAKLIQSNDKSGSTTTNGTSNTETPTTPSAPQNNSTSPNSSDSNSKK